MASRRRRITRNGKTVVRRVRSPKNAASRRTQWGGRSFPLLRWTHWIFGNRRVFKRDR